MNWDLYLYISIYYRVLVDFFPKMKKIPLVNLSGLLHWEKFTSAFAVN